MHYKPRFTSHVRPYIILSNFPIKWCRIAGTNPIYQHTVTELVTELQVFGLWEEAENMQTHSVF